LSIDWSSVQWLAAGITVGLGFGLQEIFANFVSGMILLFERPIRVGDIVTLGDVTGCVTSIRIRATTVTDWDRKELIVPNKDLVTGRLLNWTLSDTTNRIVIELAIPFRSDAGRARRLMEQVVSGHGNVLREPAPSVTFESFNEGTLRFVIRAYLASLDVRLQTIHELHVTLHQRLQTEGIGIALPQRDINVRDASSSSPVRELPSGAQRSEAA
jgi:potassium efflux system protein